MYYTYILSSIKQPGAIYIGSTKNLKSRIQEHNASNNKGISKRYAPWSIETYISFQTIAQAKKFEKYLKSNSGKAFLRKRLISNFFREALEKFNNGRGKVKRNMRSTAKHNEV